MTDKMREALEAALAVETGRPADEFRADRIGDTYASVGPKYAWWGWQAASAASAFRSLLAERNSLACLLKRFVDGEHDQDENQGERHMYHDEAQNLLAYLGGEVQGHTLVPDDILRAEHEKKKALVAENERLTTQVRLAGVSAEVTVHQEVGRAITETLAVTIERDQLKAFAVEMINASFEGGSFDGGDIQDIAVKHGLLRIEQREEECGERCACREYGFPAECYRKTSILGEGCSTVDSAGTGNYDYRTDLAAYFGLSYASWLTLPRVLMEAMPDDWRRNIAPLLHQYDEAYPNQPDYGTTVRVTVDGELVKTPSWLTNYRHPDRAMINQLRAGGSTPSTDNENVSRHEGR